VLVELAARFVSGEGGSPELQDALELVAAMRDVVLRPKHESSRDASS
jgi:hypothetical protein